MSFSFYFRSLPLLMTLSFLYNGIRCSARVMLSKHSPTCTLRDEFTFLCFVLEKYLNGAVKYLLTFVYLLIQLNLNFFFRLILFRHHKNLRFNITLWAFDHFVTYWLYSSLPVQLPYIFVTWYFVTHAFRLLGSFALGC